MFSVVAKAVEAPEYKTGPALEGSWYAYYSGVPMVGWHLWLRPGNVIFAYNTNDNLSLIGVAFAARDLPTVRANVEKHHSAVIAQHAPELWERMQVGNASRVTWAAQFPVMSASLMGRDGRWWAMRAIRKILAPRPESRMRLAALSGWPMPLTPA